MHHGKNTIKNRSTAIHEIKQILMQHLDETSDQKVRLEYVLKNQIYQNWTDKN